MCIENGWHALNSPNFIEIVIIEMTHIIKANSQFEGILLLDYKHY